MTNILGVTLPSNFSWGRSRQYDLHQSQLSEARIHSQECESYHQELKRLAYTAFVRSRMEYVSIIWDRYFIKYTQDSDVLDRVQRRTVRWITNNRDRTISVTAVLHQRHLESPQKRGRIS